jgi:hypothetical protein
VSVDLDVTARPRADGPARLPGPRQVSRALLTAVLLVGMLVVAPRSAEDPPGPAPSANDDAAPASDLALRSEVAPGRGLWLSTRELASLPTVGPAWERVVEVADERLREDTDLGRRDDHNVRTLAAALVGARLDDDRYRRKALEGLRTVVEEEPHDDLLAAARRLSTYVIAADVLDLSSLDPAFDARFRGWVDRMRHHEFEPRRFGSTIIDAAEGRPNNWGTHAGASRVAAAVYLGDEADLTRAAQVFKGYLGDRDTYDGFRYGKLDWQADPARPVGINPVGATIDGRSVDGVLPDDQRRGGRFRWPPPRENYVWEALQGATVQAELLSRQGYDAWEWEDRALLRAVTWLHDEAEYPAEGDDRWIPWLVNRAYGTRFPTEETSTGKSMGFTDWTHARPRLR